MLLSLAEIYADYSGHTAETVGDKGNAHTYVEEYERLLKPYRRNSSVLEIGIYAGLSLQMWQEYFINSKIFGIDIDVSRVNKYCPVRDFTVIEGDSTDPSILEKLGDTTFDVLIDDGSHIAEDQFKTFEIFKGRMNPGGIYIIEDIWGLDHYRPQFIALHDNCEIIDNRWKKGRGDDILIIYRF